MVACPNYESWDAKYYGNSWAAWDVPRHLSHFSSKSLNIILKPQGFKIVRKSPLFLDAIYVSILSEKIKKNTLAFLKGLIVGLVSNLAGFFTKKYSSHVYFFKNTWIKRFKQLIYIVILDRVCLRNQAFQEAFKQAIFNKKNLFNRQKQ